ncbi:class A beta-lactamase [Streptomyces liangshanensis]|uniref:Beta-lactamase n=1 Tax=Streptomyces liangshanensis TaxID=2717324 RepID=A0A6G9H805_9ACTN|nr:class A beta-lactamase [Streptomyces liangshanensis]QIQ06620.1 class A beta-lactamase [Streptomyces liangshanensis]
MLAAGAGTALAGVVPLGTSAYASTPRHTALTRRLRNLERERSARLGVFAQDMATGRTVVHRGHELFPVCSVFKTLAVAAVLRDLDTDGTYLSRRIRYTKQDVVRSGHAPITGLPENLARGMTVEALCAATITHSDNTAANLLLAKLGGPSSVTRFCRSVGDFVTRLDRWEPDLNSAEPDRTTDTTSPYAVGRTNARLILGDALDPADRDRLAGWLLANTTGGKRLRAGVPGDWSVAEKTGTGAYGTTNDVGVAWRPGRGSVVLSVLSTTQDPDAPADDELIARAAALIAAELT